MFELRSEAISRTKAIAEIVKKPSIILNRFHTRQQQIKITVDNNFGESL